MYTDRYTEVKEYLKTAGSIAIELDMSYMDSHLCTNWKLTSLKEISENPQILKNLPIISIKTMLNGSIVNLTLTKE